MLSFDNEEVLRDLQAIVNNFAARLPRIRPLTDEELQLLDKGMIDIQAAWERLNNPPLPDPMELYMESLAK